jgi:hypothetical protein
MRSIAGIVVGGRINVDEETYSALALIGTSQLYMCPSQGGDTSRFSTMNFDPEAQTLLKDPRSSS